MMTESKWLASTDVARMLAWITCNAPEDDRGAERWREERKPSDRKLRLFICGCCRQVWDVVPCPHNCYELYGCRWGNGQQKCNCVNGTVGGLTDPRSRNAVEVAEKFADGEATDRERGLAMNAVDILHGPQAFMAAACLRANARQGASEMASNAPIGQDIAVQAALLRDICGNPWHHPGEWYRGEPEHGIPSLPPKWLAPVLLWNGGVVPAIAREMYESRDFSRMPLLGDALEDAGCTDPQILEHCRGLVPPGTWGGFAGPHVRGCWVVDLILGKE